VSEARHCAACGAAAAGNFCSACGTSLRGNACKSCGAALSAGAVYCAECGQPAASRETKPATARIPWILSAVALAVFALVLANLVQSGSVRRVGDMTVTGGLPTPREAPNGAPAGGANMPSMEELASMSPRQAADRLYDRAMSELDGGDFERSAFFLDMGLQAYAAVPPEEIDADARFHMGLMQLHLGDTAAARQNGVTIVEGEPDHLLGLILLARVSEFEEEADVAAEYRERMRAVVDEAGGIPDLVEYESHRPLIERELAAGS
jgi:hypothetical protein